MTVPLTIIAFSLGMIIAIITALGQFANIRVLRQITRFYIWVICGTPLREPDHPPHRAAQALRTAFPTR